MPITRTLFYNFETPTDLIYGRFYDPVNIRGFIQTSGSSTTTTAVESSGDGSTPFDVVQVGDWLMVESNTGTQTFRRVIAKASSISLTVNSAWDLSGGKAAKLFPFRSGTGATDGAVFVGSAKNATVSWNLTTLASTSVRLVIEAKMSDPNATWTTLHDETFTTTDSDSFSIVEPWSFVRVGVEDVGGPTTGDVISVYLTVDDNVVI